MEMEETYKVKANRAVVGEGGRIIYSITTSNVAEGKMLFYTLSGANDTDDITEDDIEGGNLTGSFVIEDSKSEVIVTIAEDSVDESAEVLNFSIDNTNAFADVTIDQKDLRKIKIQNQNQIQKMIQNQKIPSSSTKNNKKTNFGS